MSLRATSTATDGQFVIATLYDEVCISHENLAEAQIVSVESPSILSKVLVPHHIKQLLMTAGSCSHQLRFNMTFDFPQDSRLPIITAASAVPFNTYSHLQPIPTTVSCGFCLEDPFDYKTGKWLPNVHRLAARDGASELKIELYYKCIRLLQARSVLPVDDNIFRFKTQNFHQSDGDLLQNVAHQRWLTRATLPTLYYRSYDVGEPVRLLAMKSDIQHENIKRLQTAVRSAFAALARRPQQGALTHAVEVGGRRRCREMHDMDVVLEALKSARKGQGHPFTASFVEACRLYCTRRDSELPFTITKQPNSFAVCKVYLVKLDQCRSLRRDAFLSTTLYPCAGQHWTPNLQKLLDDSERLGPREFSKVHVDGIQFKRDNEPVSLCLQQQRIEGECWFQMGRTETRTDQCQRLQAQNLARKELMQDCDHVWSSDFTELVHKVAIFGLADAADGA